jgi:hypothetical protein
MRKHIVCCIALLLPACSGTIDDPPMTWDEFRASVLEEEGHFLVDGDEVYQTETDLADYYSSYLAAPTDQDVGEQAQPLTVNRVGGRDDRWGATAALNLTYCVSQASFGTRYNAVVTAMSQAAAAWEAVARVNFIHDANADANCTRSTPVVFNVRQNSSTQYLAYAFFPSQGRAQRELVISSLGFVTDTGPVTLAGVLRHELGHTLGFRHEHIRNTQAPAKCREGGTVRVLTPYDSSSVMHYPQCAGTNKGDLVLTALDKLGAGRLYP